MDDGTPIEGDNAGSPDPVALPPIEQVADSIWRLTEEVLELLRSKASSEVQKQKGPHDLWLDDVTRSQGNTVIAIKHLCDMHPAGITLKKLAETINVTPAAASVMVELLVKKKMLERTRSQSDRRAVLIRLTPQTSSLFDTTDRSLRQSVMGLADLLGPRTLYDWQKILTVAASALQELVGSRMPAEPESPKERLT